MLLWLWTSSLAFAGAPASFVAACPDAPLVVAEGMAARIELSYVNLDEDQLREAQWGLDLAIPCIDEELSVFDAVQIHRARAITAYFGGDQERARRSLIAIRTLQPDWTPPMAMMPEGHPLRALWDVADDSAEPTAPLPTHAGGWNVDGSRSLEAPTHRAFLLQAFTPSGDVVLTRYCEGTDCLIEAEHVAVSIAATRRQRAARRIHWAGTVAGAAAVGGGVTGIAVASGWRQQMMGATDDEVSRLGGKANRASALGWTGAALGVTTVAVSWAVAW